MIDLEPGEEMVVRAPLHPFVRAPNVGFSSCVVAATALVIARNDLAGGTIAMLCGAAALVVLLATVVPFVRRRGFELAVTTRRILVRTGDGKLRIFERRRIERAEVEQTWWSRLLGHGAVAISQADGGLEVYPGVGRVEAIRAALGRRGEPVAKRRDGARR